MTGNIRKRELVREYKEAKKPQGIFAVRCTASGEVWLGASRNLEQQKNGIWFQLKMGGHTNKALQAAWNAHGADAFAYEIVEEVKDDNPLLIAPLLKERLSALIESMGARKVAG